MKRENFFLGWRVMRKSFNHQQTGTKDYEANEFLA